METLRDEEILDGLRELAEERRTWFREDGDDEEFRRDYTVLIAAIRRLDELLGACGKIENKTTG